MPASAEPRGPRLVARATLAAAALAVALTAAACGASKSAPPPAGGGARVVVTADWGATRVAGGDAAPGAVIDATRAVAQVATSYGGRYVDAIDGRAGDGSRDWVFWVNGIEAPVGGAEATLRTGDEVWWDLHLWSGRVHVPVVVGQWPRPLTRGLDGSAPRVSADAPLDEALRTAGADAVGPATATGPRAVVGSAESLATREPLWTRAVADPAASGLTAWIDEAGVVRVWNAQRGRVESAPGAVAVIVATTDGFAADDPPVLFVAGVSPEAASTAARLLADDAGLVRQAAAVCLDATGRIVCRGGIGALP